MLILIILGAFLWRLRGGLLNDLTGKANYKIGFLVFNDTTVRIIWSVGMTVPFCLLYPHTSWLGSRLFGLHDILSWYGAITLGLSLFAGTTLIGWYNAPLLPTDAKGALELSFSGVLRMAFPSLALLSVWPLIGGLFFGLAYWIGTRIPVKQPWQFWGEIVNGAFIGFFLSLVHYL